MTGKIIQFPGVESWNLKKLEELIDERLTHKDPDVLECIKAEIKGLVSRYYDEKKGVFKITLPAGLTPEQAREIEQSFQQTFQEYHEELRKQTHAIFLDLCLAKLENCELKHSMERKG